MGVSRDGKLAALTNIRAPYYKPKKVGTKSRGIANSTIVCLCVLRAN